MTEVEHLQRLTEKVRQRALNKDQSAMEKEGK